jgi:hypothetical protein
MVQRGKYSALPPQPGERRTRRCRNRFNRNKAIHRDMTRQHDDATAACTQLAHVPVPIADHGHCQSYRYRRSHHIMPPEFE